MDRSDDYMIEETSQMLDVYLGPESDDPDAVERLTREILRTSMSSGFQRRGPASVVESAIMTVAQECIDLLDSEEGNEQAVAMLRQHFNL